MRSLSRRTSVQTGTKGHDKKKEGMNATDDQLADERQAIVLAIAKAGNIKTIVNMTAKARP